MQELIWPEITQRTLQNASLPDSLLFGEQGKVSEQTLEHAHETKPQGVETTLVGHDPLSVKMKFGDRLKQLDKILQDAVDYALRSDGPMSIPVFRDRQMMMMYVIPVGDRWILSEQWIYEAAQVFPELKP